MGSIELYYVILNYTKLQRKELENWDSDNISWQGSGLGGIVKGETEGGFIYLFFFKKKLKKVNTEPRRM